MPNVDFPNIDLPEEGDMNFTPLPDGEYLCKLVEIDDSNKTRNGDVMWRMKFKVIDGVYSSRTIFDSMIFSERAQPRVKLICSRLGLKVDKAVNLTTDMLVGKQVYLDILETEYTNKDGVSKPTNSVLFNGYREAEGNAKQTTDDSSSATQQSGNSDDDLPF